MRSWQAEAVELAPKLSLSSRDVLNRFIKIHISDLEDAKELDAEEVIKDEFELAHFDGMKPDEIVDALVLIAAQNIQNDPIYDRIAMRFFLTKCYQSAVTEYKGENWDRAYRESFVKYIEWGVEEKLLDKRMVDSFNLYELALHLDPERDDEFTYLGLFTAANRYMVKNRGASSVRETPQFLWMRVAMGLSYVEEEPNRYAKLFYDRMARQEYAPGGSTMIGSGTTWPTLANCFLLDTEDDIDHIFENVANVAKISKGTGGIGLAITKLRAEGSPIKTNNTFSSGPIPFAKIFDATLAAISRAGKKKGAMVFYIENWHYNFGDFLDLKQNAGDDYRRTRTANTAVYISDEFMKRVIENRDWYLFDPAEVRDLTELYGAQFSEKYNEYVKMAEEGKIKMWKKLPAREQFTSILTQLQATSHPWLTWKDTINLRALNNNTGTIHCSNLCTEVCLPQDRDNIAVCNLLYVNLPAHIDRTRAQFGGELASNLKNSIDWERLEESVRLGIRQLDNLIDAGMAPVPEAKNSDMKNRAVGLGIMGFSEALELFGYAYDSDESYDLIDQIMEFISYKSIDESCNLAEVRGKYSNFDGSMWSKGFVPYDTIQKVEDDRGESLLQDRTMTMDWDALRARVRKGVRNATVMMIAPNGNSSFVAGTSPGIDPRFALAFSRTTMNGKFLDINRNLVMKLKEIGVWEQIRTELIEKQGDISEIKLIPDELKEVFKTSFQISPYAYIHVASRAQKWIDQSMSRNMYLESRDIDDMIDVYTTAWRYGVKTTYYLHMKPRHTAEQSSVKVNKAISIGKKGFAVLKEKADGEDEANPEISVVPEEREEPAKKEHVVPQVSSGKSSDKDQSQDEGSEAREEVGEEKGSEAVAEPKKRGGFGFGRVASASVSLELSEPAGDGNLSDFKAPELEKSQSKSYEKRPVRTEFDRNIVGKACPIDPIERALCESCE